jgi:hypothetical protein
LAAIPDISGLSGTIIGFVVLFIVYLLIMGFVLYVAGRIIVGRRVTFGEALGIAGTATFLVTIAIVFLLPILHIYAFLVGALIFLLLVKHYFRTGWLHAIGVAITAIIVLIIVVILLGIIALGALFALPKFF